MNRHGKRADAPATGAGARPALRRTVRSFTQMLPVLLGTLLLSSLLVAWLPHTVLMSWFGRDASLDLLLGAGLGSIAMGHPVAGYLLGGELLTAGISLVAVTALVVAWVTVGIVDMPAEALALGRAFALWRNILCFFSAIAIAGITAGALDWWGGV